MNWWDPYFQESGHLDISSVYGGLSQGQLTQDQIQGLMSFYAGGGTSTGDTSALEQYAPQVEDDSIAGNLIEEPATTPNVEPPVADPLATTSEQQFTAEQQNYYNSLTPEEQSIIDQYGFISSEGTGQNLTPEYDYELASPAEDLNLNLDFNPLSTFEQSGNQVPTSDPVDPVASFSDELASQMQSTAGSALFGDNFDLGFDSTTNTYENVMDIQQGIASGDLNEQQAQNMINSIVSGEAGIMETDIMGTDFSQDAWSEALQSGINYGEGLQPQVGQSVNPIESENEWTNIWGEVGAQGTHGQVGFDWSGVPDHILENYFTMQQQGASQQDIKNYLTSMGVSHEGIGELRDWAGGGGVGGTRAKELFYPSENTGFAGTGSGIGGGSIQDLMKQLKG